MCGIVGFIGKDNCKRIILEGLSHLQNRGYDSVGISLMTTDSIETVKYSSTDVNDSFSVLHNDVMNRELDSNLGIGHTRWATHGSKTIKNAHPHCDNKNRISLVHNGIIENYMDLKNVLKNKNYIFDSQTDTEVVAVMIGSFIDDGLDVDTSINKTISMLKGTWAFCIIHVDYPDCMWVARNGSPLLLGIEDDCIMVSSENIGFSNHTKKYIVLENDDIIKINIKTDTNTIECSCNIQHYKVNQVEDKEFSKLSEQQPHWMIKEIQDQSECITRALNNGGRISGKTSVKLGGLETFTSELSSIDHIILLGCGTSYHAGLWSMNEFKQYDIFNTVSCIDGAEFDLLDIPKKGKTAIVLLSQSGETKDLHRCIEIAKSFDLITIGVVNVPDSMISRETDCGVYLNAGREQAVASTKSFTNQCVVLSLIAIWFAQVKGIYISKRLTSISNLMKLSYQVSSIIENNIGTIKDIANDIKKNSLFVLGKGNCEAIAKEGALKIKEVSYIHAEGYSSSALKHGPFALIEEDTPIIIIDVNNKYHDKSLNACNETKSRGAFNIIITTNMEPYINLGINCKHIIEIENNETYSSLLANVCIQLLSYYMSIARGYNPDFPRNLAKVVTVE